MALLLFPTHKFIDPYIDIVNENESKPQGTVAMNCSSSCQVSWKSVN